MALLTARPQRLLERVIWNDLRYPDGATGQVRSVVPYPADIVPLLKDIYSFEIFLCD